MDNFILTVDMIRTAAAKAKQHKIKTVWIDGVECYELTHEQAEAFARVCVEMEEFLAPIEAEMAALQ